MQAWTLTDSCVLRIMLCFLPLLKREEKYVKYSEEEELEINKSSLGKKKRVEGMIATVK